MHSRQSKKYPVILVASLAAVGAAVVCDVFAQPASGPATIRPDPLNRPDIPMRSEPMVPPRLSGEEAEAFKKSSAAYQQCSRDKAAEMRLTEAAQGVISLRDRRTFWESELKNNYTLRSRYPQGFEQMLMETFNEYRSLGGSAATVAAVRSVAPPCTSPWETYRGARVPLTDSRNLPTAPK